MWWFGRARIAHLGWNKGETEKPGGDKAKNEEYVPGLSTVAGLLSLP